MFEEIIEFDEAKIKENNFDINKINAYLDKIHDVPEITKKADGHYVGITCSTELANFGNAVWILSSREWFRKTVKKWELWENGELEEDIIETMERREAKNGKRYYEE